MADPAGSSSGSMQPLPPWLQGGGRPRRARVLRVRRTLAWLRVPALVLAGAALGWMIHGWRQAPTTPIATPIAAPVVAPVACPAPPPCTTQTGATTPAHLTHARAKTPARAAALRPLPAETASTAENRREALRAFAQQKADDLRGCLGDPGRGPLRRVGAALEIDSHGTVAAVQILGGESGSRELESCYSAHLRTWRFPQTLLQGDERLLVNFVL